MDERGLLTIITLLLASILGILYRYAARDGLVWAWWEWF
jgi:hypothetical protein